MSYRFITVFIVAMLFVWCELRAVQATEALAPPAVEEQSSATKPVTEDSDKDGASEKPRVPANVNELVKYSQSKPITLAVSNELRSLFNNVPRGVDDLKAMQTHLRKLSRSIVPCTVAVRLGSGMGSGVIVSEDGYILTAGHVASRPGKDVMITLHDGRHVRGKTLGTNHGIDSGLIKISTKGKWPYAELGRSLSLKDGQWCLASGHPGGHIDGRDPPLRLGRVLARNKKAIVTDCTLVGGDSGGPLFDVQGKVIGIHSRIGDEIGANLHVPIDTYRFTWDRLVAGEIWGGRPPGDPYIGVIEAADTQDATIGEVVAGSAADKAGIRGGDVIVSFDGKVINDFAALIAAVAASEPDDRVKVDLRRGNDRITVDLVVGRYGL